MCAQHDAPHAAAGPILTRFATPQAIMSSLWANPAKHQHQRLVSRSVHARRKLNRISTSTTPARGRTERRDCQLVKAAQQQEAAASTKAATTTGPPGPPAQRSWAQILGSRIVDAVDDIASRTRRCDPNLDQLPLHERPDLVREDGKMMRPRSTKPVVLILGTGWVSHAMVKVLDTDLYDVVVLSPRDHFVFTPMLPATAVGTLEFRSLLDPIRSANPLISYYEAECEGVDLQAKLARCRSSVAYPSGEAPQFEVSYDVLVVAVGELPATFGVPGVEKHCFFMKEITDCVAMRRRIGQCCELAGLPDATDEDRRRALHFVVVGGGPTGVELAGTFEDFVREDLQKKYPELMPFVKVTLLQSAQTILTQFSRNLQERALENLRNTGVDIRMGVRVTEVTDREVVLKGGERIPYGLCVWSAGNAARPLVADLVAALPEQQEANAGVPAAAVKLAVDPYLRVVGAEGVMAMGDCSLMLGGRLPTTGQVAGQQGAHAARVLNRGYSLGRGGMDQPPPCRVTAKPWPAMRENPEGTGLQECEAMLPVEEFAKPFEFLSLGIMAYVGNDRALTQIEAFDKSIKLHGVLAWMLCNSVYLAKQVSLRNRVLVMLDWLKFRLFGRDISQV